MNISKLSLVAMVLALLLPSGCGSKMAMPKDGEARLDRRCGEAVADLVKSQLKGSPRVALVAYKPDGQGATGEVEQSFLQRVDKRGVELVKTVYLDPPKRGLNGMERQTLSADMLRRELSGLGELDAIVSLCGEPSGKAMALKALPPFFCLSHEGETVPELMKQGIVLGAYVPRRSVPDADSDWFEMLYQLALPESVEAIYGQ